MTSFPSEVITYVGRIRQFERVDWSVYVGWVGLMLGLVASTGGFLLFGHLHGVRYPAEAWMVPLWIPAMVLTVLSFFYSVVDEVFHWRRYAGRHADRVEMWSHVGILIGHSTMMIGWWCWFFAGYPGVAETVRALQG
jgi:hypothetical protein